jgi:hypothetical protein
MTVLCKSRRLINQAHQKVDRWDDPLLSHKTPICIRTLGLHFFKIYFKATHPPIPNLVLLSNLFPSGLLTKML